MMRLTRAAVRHASSKPAPVSAHAAVRAVLAAGAAKRRKFDEGVDLDVVLSLDPKKPLQQVRGVAALPHGPLRHQRVAAFCEEDDEQDAATAAGADVVGGEDLLEKVAGGALDFDVCVASASLAAAVKRKCGRVLGPRGLLPSPKNEGTVADDAEGLADLVKQLKKGRVKLKTEPKAGVLHAPFGRLSFGEDALLANLRALSLALVATKPEGTPKGAYVLSATLSSTMGPGVPVDVATIDPASPHFFRESD